MFFCKCVIAMKSAPGPKIALKMAIVSFTIILASVSDPMAFASLCDHFGKQFVICLAAPQAFLDVFIHCVQCGLGNSGRNSIQQTPR